MQNGLKGKRIGIEKDGLKVSPAMDKIFREAIEALKSQGAAIVEVELYKQNKRGWKSPDDCFAVRI